MKKCSKCKQEKETINFCKSKSSRDGFFCRCKQCSNELNLKWVMNNKKRVAENKKRWAKNNKKKVAESNKKWITKFPEKRKEWNRIAKARNKEHNYLKTRLWLSKHPERIKEYNYKKNIQQRSTPCGKLSCNMKTYIGRWLKGSKNGKKWVYLVGYTSKELRIHLESQFVEGMNWDNYGLYGWHIDHKIPVSAFTFSCPEDEEFKLCWSLNNLQPLWAKENISKGNKIDKSFLSQLKQKEYRPASAIAGY